DASSKVDMAGGPSAAATGVCRFEPCGGQDKIPDCYRLEAHQFDWQLKRMYDMPVSGVEVSHLSFPSPVVTKCMENNTVHGEYYRPVGKGPFPGVIVLDITAGDQTVSRMIATQLASRRIAALFVQMAYYGP